MARIANADGTFPTYEPQEIFTTGGSGALDPALFGNPDQPNKPFHFNLDTSAYTAGIYRIVLVFLTDNDIARVRYIRLVD